MKRHQRIVSILLIEDNPIDQLEVKRVLEEIQILFRLKVTQNAEEAFIFLSEVSETKLDIILLRLNTTKLKGMEFIRMIKFNSDWRDIKIFILSTPGEIESKSEFLKSGIAEPRITRSV